MSEDRQRVVLYFGCIHDAPPVSHQPSVDLVQWRVFALPDATIRLSGMLAERPTLRVTTPIVSVAHGAVVTSSGRRYQLVGGPASDPDILTLMAQQLTFLGFVDFIDLTLALLGADFDVYGGLG